MPDNSFKADFDNLAKDTVVEWIYRSARSARLVDGASEVHMMVLAKFMRDEGRDFWQMPLLPLDLLVQSWLASAAALTLLAPWSGDAQQTLRIAAGALAGAAGETTPVIPRPSACSGCTMYC